jgi:hypothetical protein
MRPFLSAIILSAASACFVASAFAGGSFHDPEREFSFTLPDGFVEQPGGQRGEKLALAFTRGEMGQPGYAVLQISSLGGTIGRSKIDPAIVERAARNVARGSGIEITKFEYRTVKWRGFDLDLVISQAVKNNVPILTFSTQIPLARQAVQINLAGAATEEERLSADLHGIVLSLNGQSSWLTDAERSERLAFSVGGIAGVLGVIVVAVFLALRELRHRRAKGKR